MAEFNQGRNWIDKQLQRGASVVIVVGIPLAILALDLLVRFAAQGDVSDAPADLCMLALMGFGSILTDDIRQCRDLKEEARKAIERQLAVDVLYFIVFLVLWFLSLVLVSSRQLQWGALSVPDSTRVVVAAIIGMANVGYVASLVAGGYK